MENTTTSGTTILKGTSTACNLSNTLRIKALEAHVGDKANVFQPLYIQRAQLIATGIRGGVISKINGVLYFN